MLNTSFPPWPAFSNEEADAVRDVILSNKVNYWTGQEARNFESEFADYVGVEHAVAVANGTVALDLALKAVGVGEGDEVIVTPRTFIASVSTVVNTGATPVFADVDLNTQNISSLTIAPVISERTKAIIVVHLAGMPAEMDEIMALAKQHSLYVIEDCAQAHGARYKGRSVGSIGHIGAWSFCQEKIMTTGGEGGMVTTSDKALWSTMWSYKDHGKSLDALDKSTAKWGFQWVHESFGTNWRMLEVQATIGRIQTRKMPEWQKSRSDNAQEIWRACSTCDWLRVPEVADHLDHAAYKAYVFVEPDKLPPGWSREHVITSLLAEGVPAFTGSCPEVYLELAFEGTGFRPAERLANARQLGETSLMFLVHPTLERKHIDQTVAAISAVDHQIIKARQDRSVG